MSEVYIDGVNVAECECYYYSIQTHCNYCNMSQYSSYCNDYPDCHFKQFQRAKAENERLKEIILKREQTDRERIGCKYPSALELSIQLSRNTTIELEKQKAENEKLKAELENYKRID